MSTLHEKPHTAVDRFWERFIERAREEGIKASAIRWYVHHAEGYLKAVTGRRLSEHEHPSTRAPHEHRRSRAPHEHRTSTAGQGF